MATCIYILIITKNLQSVNNFSGIRINNVKRKSMCASIINVRERRCNIKCKRLGTYVNLNFLYTLIIAGIFWNEDCTNLIPSCISNGIAAGKIPLPISKLMLLKENGGKSITIYQFISADHFWIIKVDHIYGINLKNCAINCNVIMIIFEIGCDYVSGVRFCYKQNRSGENQINTKIKRLTILAGYVYSVSREIFTVINFYVILIITVFRVTE